MNPAPEKKMIAIPPQNGMNPLLGEEKDPNLYWREPMQMAKPIMNNTPLLT
jgi:hypothetical protein